METDHLPGIDSTASCVLIAHTQCSDVVYIIIFYVWGTCECMLLWNGFVIFLYIYTYVYY